MPLVDVNFNGIKPKFTRPEILQHPNIPKSLSGVNPRTLMGKDAWDVHRRTIYEVNNYHCFACGVASAEAPFHQWLEAHECYDYHWTEKVLAYKETVALCYQCHNFIHCGRLTNLYLDAKMALTVIQDIMMYGLTTLQRAGLKPDQKAIQVARVIAGRTWDYVKANDIKATNKSVVHNTDLLDPGWRLSYQGKFYNTLGREIKDG